MWVIFEEMRKKGKEEEGREDEGEKEVLWVILREVGKEERRKGRGRRGVVDHL